MNNKAQATFGFAIIVGIMIFIVGMLVVNFIKDEVTTARTATVLNCEGADISDGTKLTCLAVDWVVPYFIILVFSIAGGGIAAKLVLR